MSLTLYYHPLSSFCQKALIALYENETAFAPHMVDLMDETSRAAFLKIWPIGKFPVLRDEDAGETIAEATIIIEYLAQHYPGRTKLVPTAPDMSRRTRMADRFYDLYINTQVGKIVTNRLRPADQKDTAGVEQAHAQIQTALDMTDKDMAEKEWATGDAFTMADCAAAPALFYADKITPFAQTHKNAYAYLQRLMARPSYARALKEAEPYLEMMPK
jgi:glutathione S-transferase